MGKAFLPSPQILLSFIETQYRDFWIGNAHRNQMQVLIVWSFFLNAGKDSLHRRQKIPVGSYKCSRGPVSCYHSGQANTQKAKTHPTPVSSFPQKTQKQNLTWAREGRAGIVELYLSCLVTILALKSSTTFQLLLQWSNCYHSLKEGWEWGKDYLLCWDMPEQHPHLMLT